ncbi:MAG: methionine adenosyltransferase [bacterium]
MTLRLRRIEAALGAAGSVEVVERKGAGHPDTLCDAIAEELSRALSRFYVDRFGCVLHHNVDKVLLVGGAARPSFGGGRVDEPIELILAGRATREVGGVVVPVEDIAATVVREFVAARFRFLDPAQHVRIACRIRPGSVDLLDVFARQRRSGAPRANDSSCGVGFAPETELERLVLAVERHINAAETKRLHPELGEDVKVMGVREDADLRLTVACAFVDRHVASLADYLDKKERLASQVRELARQQTGRDVTVHVNTADDPERGSVYLTVTGTSAEAGDDGEVGRGNRANGLITPHRPMTLEAAAGKNPISHVGKLYQITSRTLAAAVAREIPGVSEARCCLVSEIGHPITEPALVEIAIGGEAARDLDGARAAIGALAGRHLAHTVDLWREILDGQHTLY